ncbi:MAG TPA: tripartite tricarboxylate transporter substrate binding protein [Burkholderiales bacterium]|nr:tripartite tricarboxylate transporter substrate binding protein [Burkholderiales bacterium]
MNIRTLSSCRVFAACAAALFALACGAAPGAQTYPVKPIRLLVPFAAGGGNDALARILGARLGEAFGNQVVVDNRAGAGGIIANEVGARAAPDGYTLLLGYLGPLAVSPSLQKVSYDPVADFVSLGFLASSYHVLVVHPSVPARSVKELIAYAKAKPGTLNSAYAGAGAAGHLATELFRSVVGIDIVHVPYRGSGPASAAVMSGEAQMQFASISSSMPFVRDKRLIALAVTSPKRLASAPEVPTLIESGVSGVDAQSWYTLLAPTATPREIVDKLSGELNRILATAQVREQLSRLALETQPMSPAEFTKFLKAEIAKWGKIVRAAGIKPE